MFGFGKKNTGYQRLNEAMQSQDEVNYRDEFTKPTGMLLERFSNLTKEQKNDVLDFQGKLTAISIAKTNAPQSGEDINIPDDEISDLKNLNLKDIKNSQKADEIIKTFSISQEVQQQGKEKADSQKGVPRDVPLFGFMLADAGLVNPKTKDALMVAQAAERTIEAYEGKSNFMSDKAKDAFKNQNADDRMFQRDFVGKQDEKGKFKDPKSTVKAQAINHMADIISGYVASKDEGEKIPQEVKVAQKALLGLAKSSFFDAQRELKQLSKDKNSGVSPEAAVAANSIIKDINAKKKEAGGILGAEASLTLVERGLKTIAKEFKEKSPEFSEKLSEIIGQRLDQSRGVEKKQGQGLSR